MSENFEVKEKLKFSPHYSTMVMEAGEIEKALNRALMSSIDGFKGCRYKVENRTFGEGKTAQIPMIYVFVSKGSNMVKRPYSDKLAFVMGSESSYELSDKLKGILNSFIPNDVHLIVSEKKKSIMIQLDFSTVVKKLFDGIQDGGLQYAGTDYVENKHMGEVYRYINFIMISAEMKKELDALMYNKSKGPFDGFRGKNRRDEEDDEDDKEYNSDI